MTSPEWNLLEKTELRIEGIRLHGANLTDIAAVVADVLELPRTEVVVIDARDELIALDVLRRTLNPYQVAGKQADLLRALGQLLGVHVDARTSLCSEGMLGWIASDSAEVIEALDKSTAMAVDIHRAMASRAIVFSTGPEVLSGQIEDTNKPWIAAHMRQAGFNVTEGRNLPDEPDTITAALREAGEELGYGVIVTTGGVGAEGKDGTVEALLVLDPEAATPTLFTVQQGHGRHTKAQVRISVGEVGTALVVCLPGPHAEASQATETLVTALARTRDKQVVATEIARSLRARLRLQHREHS